MSLVRLGYGVAAAMWLVSLVLPAADVDSMRLMGHRAFMIGIDALGNGVAGWLANPVAAAAIIAGLLARRWLAAGLAGVALLLALSSYRAPASARASGVPIGEVSFEVGFFLWLAAFSLILATSVFALIESKRRSAER